MADTSSEQLNQSLRRSGLFVRGKPLRLADIGENADASSLLQDGYEWLLMIGHFGSSHWPSFRQWWAKHPSTDNPLDKWSEGVLAPLAAVLNGEAIVFDAKCGLPVQRMAMIAENLQPSPLGMLIHPTFGLWHAWRGALVLKEALHGDMDEVADVPATIHPCSTCVDKPCLSACPVDAFTGEELLYSDCQDHLKTKPGKTCMSGGCLARAACPIGRQHVYSDDHIRFHMQAFGPG